MTTWKAKEWDKIDVIEIRLSSEPVYYFWFHNTNGWYTHAWSIDSSTLFLLVTDNYCPSLVFYSLYNVNYDRYYFTCNTKIVHSLSNTTELLDFCTKAVTEKLL